MSISVMHKLKVSLFIATTDIHWATACCLCIRPSASCCVLMVSFYLCKTLQVMNCYIPVLQVRKCRLRCSNLPKVTAFKWHNQNAHSPLSSSGTFKGTSCPLKIGNYSECKCWSYDFQFIENMADWGTGYLKAWKANRSKMWIITTR